jgi:hypothetical protein
MRRVLAMAFAAGIFGAGAAEARLLIPPAAAAAEGARPAVPGGAGGGSSFPAYAAAPDRKVRTFCDGLPLTICRRYGLLTGLVLLPRVEGKAPRKLQVLSRMAKGAPKAIQK